jgi:hypothetical protein
MKENREEYEQLADRAARLLAALANVIMKATPEKLKGMEGNVARLLMCVIVTIIFARCFDSTGQHVEGDPVDDRCAPRRSDFHKQAPFCEEVHSHQGQGCCAGYGGSRSGREARPAARPRDRGVRRAHLNIPGLDVRAYAIDQLTSSIRVELVMEDVRALSVRLSNRIEELNLETAKRIEEMNQEMLRTAMNGTQHVLR